MKDIVSLASEYGIEVIPEIDMPGIALWHKDRGDSDSLQVTLQLQYPHIRNLALLAILAWR